MFSKLTDFGFKRDSKQAFGFYIAYIIFIIFLAAVAGAITGAILGSQGDSAANFQLGLRIGSIVGIVGPLILSFLVLYRKNLHTNFGLLLIAFLSAVLGVFGGALLGLIPTAFLTTK